MTPKAPVALALLAALPALALAGCLGGSGGPDYETLSVNEWKRRYESTPGAVLLDVRTPEEFAQGHLANATLLPYDEIQGRAAELPRDKDTPIYVYCRSGNRSATASGILADLGYTNVVNLDGGILDWMNAGHPVVA